MTADPSKLSVEEVRELLGEVKEAKCGRMLTSYESSTIAALCRHYLASREPMTAGEFAGLVIGDLKQVADDYRGVGTWNGATFTEYAIDRVASFAREHNITIVEPKK